MRWDVCPLCGAELQVRSIERLDASNHLDLQVAVDGSLDAVAFGLTEPDWTSCVTLAYQCDACDGELPEAYQRVLDARLDNRREEGA